MAAKSIDYLPGKYPLTCWLLLEDGIFFEVMRVGEKYLRLIDVDRDNRIRLAEIITDFADESIDVISKTVEDFIDSRLEMFPCFSLIYPLASSTCLRKQIG